MIGEKLYMKKRRVYFFLLVYAGLLIAGILIAMQSLSREENVSNASGFLLIFGAGMFVMTLVKSRKPQVTVHEDYLALNQSRTTQLVRYRYIISVSRPDNNKLIVKLLEDGIRKEIPIYLRELVDTDIERLTEFLMQKGLKKHS